MAQNGTWKPGTEWLGLAYRSLEENSAPLLSNAFAEMNVKRPYNCNSVSMITVECYKNESVNGEDGLVPAGG